MLARVAPRHRSASDRFYDDGTPEWVYVADLARMEGISRVQAWRLMGTLRRALGPKLVQQDATRRWRARTHAVARWLANRHKTDAERIAALEHRVAELEGTITERDARVDQLAADVAALRDMAGGATLRRRPV
jgi:hypothetical protein